MSHRTPTTQGWMAEAGCGPMMSRNFDFRASYNNAAAAILEQERAVPNTDLRRLMRETDGAILPVYDSSTNLMKGNRHASGIWTRIKKSAAKESKPATRRRRALLEAAWHELTEVGYSGLTREAVVARAETSRSIIHRRWPTRWKPAVAAINHHRRVNPVSVSDTGNHETT